MSVQTCHVKLCIPSNSRDSIHDVSASFELARYWSQQFSSQQNREQGTWTGKKVRTIPPWFIYIHILSNHSTIASANSAFFRRLLYDTHLYWMDTYVDCLFCKFSNFEQKSSRESSTSPQKWLVTLGVAMTLYGSAAVKRGKSNSKLWLGMECMLHPTVEAWCFPQS